MRTSVDSRFVLQRSLWSLTSISVFDSISGGISDLKLQSLRLLRFAFGLWRVLRASLYASAGAISIGWVAPAPRAGAGTGCGPAPEPGADGQHPAAALLGQLYFQWILFYLCMCTVATVILNFGGNGRCCRALDWSSEVGCRAEAEFRVNQTIITHFCVIITSLLPVMTVIMALLLHIFTSLLRHYYALIHLLLHRYYLLLL